MANTNNNLILQELTGQLGKQLVLKQHRGKTIVSKYPDMSRVKPSPKQLAEKSKFSKAVQYAQSILKDAAKKAAYTAQLKPNETVYHNAIKEYLAKHK